MALRAGFIGVGNQGKPIAAHYAPSGFDTTVYDVDPGPVAELVEGGAVAAATPREVGERSDVVGICVPEDDHVRAVVYRDDGLLAGLAPGSVIAIHSTIQPDTAQEIAAEAAKKEVGVLDACVTGGESRAQAKQLTFLVGGDEASLEKARPLLELSSVKIIHAGPLGSGAKLKLCINLITYTLWSAVRESYELAVGAGLDPAVLEEAGVSNGQITPLMQAFMALLKAPEEVRKGAEMQTMLRRNAKIGEKDLAWALALARKSDVSIPVGGLLSQLMGPIYGVED
jgi:3-hydroxyisobutyrate dehydrogenase